MKKLIKRILTVLGLLVIGIWLYAGSLIGVEKEARIAYKKLRKEIRNKGFQPKIFVISGKRWNLDNQILTRLSSASKNSQHLTGKAIDIIILDVNEDGEVDGKDVDLVYQILEEKILNGSGGIGTYKNEKGFLNKQMIHFDLRKNKSRWNR